MTLRSFILLTVTLFGWCQSHSVQFDRQAREDAPIVIVDQQFLDAGLLPTDNMEGPMDEQFQILFQLSPHQQSSGNRPGRRTKPNRVVNLKAPAEEERSNPTNDYKPGDRIKHLQPKTINIIPSYESDETTSSEVTDNLRSRRGPQELKPENPNK